VPYAYPRIIALLFALMLTACEGDRFSAPTKCDAVSAVLLDQSATRDQVAKALARRRSEGKSSLLG
jgi:hypothetical protein